MKKYIAMLLAGAALTGCSDKKAQEKAILDTVMKIHEKVMASDEQLMKNKMLLDSLVKHSTVTSVKDSATAYIGTIALADSAMSDWMHKFDYDRVGKSNDENIVYFNDQKKLIMKIDSQISKVAGSSTKYLTQTKK